MNAILDLPHTAASTTHFAPERYNFYVPIHKAMRSIMSETLCRVGRLDVADPQEMDTTLAQLDTLLALCTSHIAHEDDFAHPAIEARVPGGSALTASNHVDHLESIAALGEASALLAAADVESRPVLALRLYRHLALFIAESLQHFHTEETVNATALQAVYSDDELHAIHDRLLATLPPLEHLLVARWMVPAVTPAERAAIFDGMKTQMPPESLLGVLMRVLPHVDMSGRVKLQRDIGVPAVPGLVDTAQWCR